MAGNIDKATTDQLKELVRLDDNIDLIKKDLKEYAASARETIQSLIAQKRKLREELNQLPLFGEAQG